MKQLLFFIISILFGAQSSLAQLNTEANWTFIFDGYNTTDFADMVVDKDGNTYVGINYSMQLKVPELKATFPYGKHVSRIVVKLDKNGKAIWGHPFESDYDGRIQSMALAPNGDLIIAGFCDGMSTFPSPGDTLTLGYPKPKNQYHRPQFLFITRYTNKGKRLWAKVLSEAGGGTGGVCVNQNDEIYWSVYHRGVLKEDETVLDTFHGIDKINIFKLNGKGDIIGKLPLSHSNKIRIVAPKLAIDKLGNVVVYGTFRDRIDLTENDSLTNDGYYESSDAYIAVYNPEGQLKWCHKFGGRNYQEIKDVAIDKNNNFYITGSYSYECILSKGIKTQNKSEYEYKSGSSLFYCKLTGNGDLEFVRYHTQKNYSSSITGTSLDLDANGNIYLSGTFNDSLQLDSIQPAIVIENKNSNASFISIWQEDSLINVQSDIQADKSWHLTQKIRVGGNNVVYAGIYFGKTQLKTPSGKKFNFTEKDHGRSSFVVGFHQPKLLNKLSDTAKTDHLEEIADVLVCIAPSESDPKIWFPLNLKDSSHVEQTDPSYTETCGVKLVKSEAKLYPNPTSAETNLLLKGFSGLVNIEIISEKGDLLLSQKVDLKTEEESLNFDLSNMADGMYYFIVTQNGFRKSMRLVKVK